MQRQRGIAIMSGMTQGKSQEEELKWRGLAAAIKAWGRELGFGEVGIAGTDLTAAEAGLSAWLGKGRHGEMDYMERHGVRRARPAELLPGTLRVICARLDYLPEAADAERTLADAN